MVDSTTAALMLLSYGAGGASSLLLYVLLRQPKPTDTPVEGVDDLLDRVNVDGRDLPTQILHLPRPGPGYTGRYRRKSANQRLADLGRAHTRRRN